MSLSILLKRRWKKIKLKEYIRKHTTILLDRVLAKVATPAALWIRLMMIVAIEPKIARAISILNASDWSILSILKWDSEKYPPLIIPATVEITLSKIVSCIVTSFSKLCFFFIAKKSQGFKHLAHYCSARPLENYWYLISWSLRWCGNYLKIQQLLFYLTVACVCLKVLKNRWLCLYFDHMD